MEVQLNLLLKKENTNVQQPWLYFFNAFVSVRHFLSYKFLKFPRQNDKIN